MNSLLETALAALPKPARILDAGGWFKPLARATHVLDLMPYETRRGVVTPGPLPDECFARDTWLQMDFLAPELRLPFADYFFDFVVCTHTIEDLADPAPLLRELRRIARAGYFETPSRLCEQTVGQRDRMCSAQGHPHHHWIIESDGGSRLLLWHKADSLDGNPASRVPLYLYEKLVGEGGQAESCQLRWSGSFEFEFVRGSSARERAAAFAAGFNITPADRTRDALIRTARRIKRFRRRSSARATRDWWREMLRISQPYSRIPLR